MNQTQTVAPSVELNAPPAAGGFAQALKGAGSHVFIIPAFLIAFVVLFWFVTQGSGRLFEVESFGTYYDALSDSMLHLHFDVPEEDLSDEAFVRKGRHYGYFGMTPALLRMPVTAIFHRYKNEWSRLSVLAACMMSLLYTYRIMLAVARSNGKNWRWDHLDRAMVAGLILFAGIGSTHLFMVSRVFIYHEAIVWGSTLALVSSYYAYRYLTDGKLHFLIEAAGTAFLAFFARPTAGAGAVLMCSLLSAALFLRWVTQRKPATMFWFEGILRALGLKRIRTPLRDSMVAGAFVLLTCVGYLSTNYVKFRTFNGVPVQYYQPYLLRPERMKATGGRQIHLANLRTCFMAYFGRAGIEFRPTFPWIFMPSSAHAYPEARIDTVEWGSTFPSSMPWLCLLSLMGTIRLCRSDSPAIRSLRLPVIGMAVGGGLILFTVGITERYLHDLYPFLILTAVVGLYWLTCQAVAAKKTALVALSLLGLFSIFANGAFALDYQRELIFGVPFDRVVNFQQWRSRIDDAVRGAPLEIIRTPDDHTPPPAFRKGQLWLVTGTDALYWYTGEKWATIRAGRGPTPYRLKVHFGPTPPRVMEALVTRGKTEAADFVYVWYMQGNRMMIGFDHWGIGGQLTKPMPIPAEGFHDLLVDLDAINHLAIIKLDGTELIRLYTPIFPANDGQLWFGQNPLEGLETRPFSGTLVRLPDVMGPMD